MARASRETVSDERRAADRRATSQPNKDTRSGNGAPAAEGAVDPRELGALVEALDAERRGGFSVRRSKRRKGVLGEVAASYNDLVEQNQRMSKELVRIARIIGREGQMTERASLPGAAAGWETSIDSLNSLIDDLVRPTTEVGRVMMAVADGDLSQKMALTIEG